MGAELGATCSIFPFDQNASEYLRQTGREEIASLAQMNAAELRADDEVLDNNAERQLCASTDFIALILNVLRIKERLQNGSAVGWLYIWKNVILVIMIILAILIYRPFCKYICPLGAFYSIFNKVSVFRYRVDEEKCIHCGKCAKACQMEVNPVENPNSAECIRCGRCKKACPTQAIQCGVKR